SQAGRIGSRYFQTYQRNSTAAPKSAPYTTIPPLVTLRMSPTDSPSAGHDQRFKLITVPSRESPLPTARPSGAAELAVILRAYSEPSPRLSLGVILTCCDALTWEIVAFSPSTVIAVSLSTTKVLSTPSTWATT